MLGTAEKVLGAAVGVFAVSGIVAMLFQPGPHAVLVPYAVDGAATAPSAVPASAVAWFQEAKPYCNGVEVDARLRWSPAPETDEGLMYEAACFALAGRIGQARKQLDRLPADTQWRGAGVVFDLGHPAADAGDETAAGPLMELVVEYWPNHYMALYHAGASRFQLGAHDQARDYLERFLNHYDVEDGWRSSAKAMLEEMGR